METFKYNGKTYAVNEKEFKSVEIPGIGIRTVGEILVDEKAQKFLVERGCVGTVILEVNEKVKPAKLAANNKPAETKPADNTQPPADGEQAGAVQQ